MMWWFILLLLFSPGPALAHSMGPSRLELTVAEAQVSAAWSIGIHDLDVVLVLDKNGDGRVTPGEVTSRREAILEYLQDRAAISADGKLCQAEQPAIARQGDQLLLTFDAQCPHVPARLGVRYDLFFEHDRSHRAELRLTAADQTETATFTQRTRERAFALHVLPSGRGEFGRYTHEGFLHSVLALDHLWLLVVLLLPVALRRQVPHADMGQHAASSDGLVRAWPHPEGGSPWPRILRVVGAYTVGCSVTLSWAACEWVVLPPVAVQVAVALSILIVAVDNIVRKLPGRGLGVPLACGLVHGWAFGVELLELAVPPDRFLTALLGFNVGLELGLLCVVVALVPAGLALRDTRLYRDGVVKGGSWLVALVALVWCVERGLGRPLFEPMWEATRLIRYSHPLSVAGVALLFIAAAGRGLMRLAWPRAVATVALLLIGAGWVTSAWVRFDNQQALMDLAADAEREARRLQRAGQMGHARARFQAARGFYHRAGDPASEADLYSRLGDFHLFLSELQSARVNYRHALEIRERLQDARGEAAEYRQLAVVARLAGDRAVAAQLLRQAIVKEEQLGLQRRVVRSLQELAQLYRGSGKVKTAKATLQRAIELARVLGLPEFGVCLSHLALIHHTEGDLVQAAELYQQAVQGLRGRVAGVELARTLANAASVAVERAERPKAIKLYREALKLFEEVDDRPRARRVRRLLAELENPQVAQVRAPGVDRPGIARQ